MSLTSQTNHENKKIKLGDAGDVFRNQVNKTKQKKQQQTNKQTNKKQTKRVRIRSYKKTR